MALDKHYIPFYNITDYFVDKDTGLPLSGGIVKFFVDTDRATQKDVFQLSGTSLNYSYTSLGSELILSSVGTFEDFMGNPVVVYGYPFDNEGNVELYFITVESEGNVAQFTVEACPYIPSDLDPDFNTNTSNENQLSNPQFVDVLFPEAYYTTPTSRIYSVSGGATIAVAPDWDIVCVGSGSITVSRVAPTQTNIPTQPPFALRVSSAGMSSVILRQRIHSPRLDVGSTSDTTYASAYVVVSSNSGDQPISVRYTPSSGTPITIIDSETVPGGGVYTPFSSSKQITGTINPSNAITGYIDLEVIIPANTDMVVTSVLLAQSDSESNVAFTQLTPERQRDQLSHYYMPQALQKPIPSYLVGWDFPMSPLQLNGNGTVAVQATGANTSFYAWDQTIVFQSANSGVSVARTSSGAFAMTAAATGQVAMIQYLDPANIKDLLLGAMSVNIAAYTNVSGGVPCAVELYYTKDTNLPSMLTNTSIVASLNADGTVATKNGTWTKIERRNNMGTANFIVKEKANENFYDYNFNGWDLAGSIDAPLATYFAIVIGTASLSTTNNLQVLSVGLMSGDAATRPAPKSFQEHQLDCQRYYYKTTPFGTGPNGTTTLNQILTQVHLHSNATTDTARAMSFAINYPTMRTNPSIQFLAPSSGTLNNVRVYIRHSNAVNNDSDIVFATYWTAFAIGPNSASYFANDVNLVMFTYTNASNSSDDEAFITYHFTADARLGIIN